MGYGLRDRVPTPQAGPGTRRQIQNDRAEVAYSIYFPRERGWRARHGWRDAEASAELETNEEGQRMVSSRFGNRASRSSRCC